MLRKVVFVILSLLFIGCAGSKAFQGVPLVWKPTSEVGSISHSGLSGVVLSIAKFTDSRKNKGEIGRNIEDVHKIKTVTTSDNVGTWTTDQFSDLLKRHGFTVSQSGNAILTGDIVDFYVDEDSNYKSRVSVKLKVANTSGKTLWEGVMSGSASRFGRSYTLENYYETLSDAMIDAVNGLLRQTDFMESLKSSLNQDSEVESSQPEKKTKSKKRSKK